MAHLHDDIMILPSLQWMTKTGRTCTHNLYKFSFTQSQLLEIIFDKNIKMRYICPS